MRLLWVLSLAACSGARTVTWYGDVAPIVQARCAGCHGAGGVAPIALDGYEEARRNADAIAADVSARIMPPWKPAPGCGELSGSRALAQEEIDTLVEWSRQGALEGAPRPLPAAPDAESLPWADLTLEAGFDYEPSAGDDYHCFVLDPALSGDRDLIGTEVQPGVRAEVHHVLLFEADRAEAAALDTGGAGWTCFGGPGVSSSSVLGGWAPGTGSTRYPDSTGVRMHAGRVIVMQVHYNTSASAPVADRTRVRLQLSPAPVQREALFWPVTDPSFVIPPLTMGYSHGANVGVPPSEHTVWGVFPHLHRMGRRISVSVGGACLVDIPSWDFAWQQMYWTARPVSLGSLASARVDCTWDNPTDRAVTWGEGTADEMCLAYVYLTP